MRTVAKTFCKLCLLVCGDEATEACGTVNLCAGLEAGIEGCIYAAKEGWSEHNNGDEFGFTLVDARNAFNKINRTAMLWTVRHVWPSGSKFAFNIYKHFATLGIQGRGPTDYCFLLSEKGVTQGCPLAMVLYALGLLTLTAHLISSMPNLFQPWHAKDGAAGGKWDDILLWCELLMAEGPNCGYFPESTNSVLIVHPDQVGQAKAKFEHLGLQVTTGNRYLGGFIGDT